MTTISFVAEWAIRSSILIAGGAALLVALRVKDPVPRLAAWTAMLCGSLAIPVLTASLPRMHLFPTNASIVVRAVDVRPLAVVPLSAPAGLPYGPTELRFDWTDAATLAYAVVAAAMLARLGVGLSLSGRLLRQSRETGRTAGGVAVLESDAVTAPVTLGITRPVIVLPPDWREWDGAKLDAVLAHERSHIKRRDPMVQALSAAHRALVWVSPMSWFLHRSIVRVAEEASDDAAVAATRDRVSYAETLLEFMHRGVRGVGCQGVAMARYGRPEERIRRILDGTMVSRGLTRRGAAAILALGAPLAYLAAAASPQAAEVPAAAAAPTPSAAPEPPQAAQSTKPQPDAAPATGRTIRRYMIFDGDSRSGSWDSRDREDFNALQTRFGSHFAWFRQGGDQYIVTDAGVLKELADAEAPQKEVNRRQNEVNFEQAKVNALQDNVNKLQNQVNTLQGHVNRRQDIVNQIQIAVQNGSNAELIQRLEAALKDLRAEKGEASQNAINGKQAEANEAQNAVNRQQARVNVLQQTVNVEQARVSAQYSRKIEQILNSALERRLAQRVM